jgi:hypothetical protein
MLHFTVKLIFYEKAVAFRRASHNDAIMGGLFGRLKSYSHSGCKMISTIKLKNLVIKVTMKKIKSLRLKVYPNGQVKISAPLHAHPKTIHDFLMSRLDWIQQSQKQLQQRQVETPRHPESDNKSRYVWGKRYLLNVIEQDAHP